MVLVDSCCGCCALRVGSMTVAIFTVFHCYVFLIHYARCVSCAEENRYNAQRNVELSKVGCYLGVIGKSIGIVSGILLFTGTVREMYFLIIQWFAVAALLVVQTAATNLMIRFKLDPDRDFINCWLLMFNCRPWAPNCKSLKADIIYFVGVGVGDPLFFGFCMIMVFSYIKDLREQKRAATEEAKRAKELERGEVEDEGEEVAVGKEDAKEDVEDTDEDETSRMEVGDA